MDSLHIPRTPQRVLIPPGILNDDENTVLDIPRTDEEMFVATSPRSQRPSDASKLRAPGERPVHQPIQRSVITVGPDPEELESREQENLEEDLKEFQCARRKLLYDVLTLQMTKMKKRVEKHLQKR